jgi:hypothetical protein
MSAEGFRSEIRDTVKTLSELNKTKLILVSGLVAVAFGIGSASRVGDFSYLTLSFIPFVCLYVDFQYYHGLAKIFVLGKFLKEIPPPYDNGLRLIIAYERFVHHIRDKASPGLFSFESKAQIGSSIMLSLLGPCLGAIALITRPDQSRPRGTVPMIIILISSSIIGTVSVCFSYRSYRRALRSIDTVLMNDYLTATNE